MATSPGAPGSKFNPPTLTPSDSKYVLQIPQMSEQEILQTLGYGDAIKNGGMPAAEAQFRQDHNNADPTQDKLDAVLRQAIYDRETFTSMGASGMTTAQAYGITTASDKTGVPAKNIASLAIAERAFDPTFKAGRTPGMIQMKETDFLETFAKYGADCSHTADLAAQIPKDPATGKPEPVSEWPKAFRNQVAETQSDPLVSAQLGTLYAKTHPVQLDIVNTYMGETAKGNQLQLGNLMRNVGGLTNQQTNLVLNPSDPEWCAATVDSAMAGAGIKPKLETRYENDPGKPTTLARDYDSFGKPIPHPSATTVKPGDVVVFDKVPHVAMVESVDKNGNFTWLGGNQSSKSNVDVDGHLNVHDPGLTFRAPPPGAFATATSAPLPVAPPAAPDPTALGLPVAPVVAAPPAVKALAPPAPAPLPN